MYWCSGVSYFIALQLEENYQKKLQQTSLRVSSRSNTLLQTFKLSSSKGIIHTNGKLEVAGFSFLLELVVPAGFTPISPAVVNPAVLSKLCSINGFSCIKKLEVGCICLGAPIGLKQSNEVVFKEGDPLRIHCHTTSPIKLTSYVWHTPNDVSQEAKEVQRKELFFLPIANRSLAGMYTCVANNSFGSTEVKIQANVEGWNGLHAYFLVKIM